jgi:hypothetical protein
MKGGMRYFGMVTVFTLLVVVIAMYISSGFQMLREDYVLIGLAGLVVVFILVAVGFIISVRTQGCSVLVKWHKRLTSDRVNKISRVFYLLLSRSSCKSCPLVSLCLGN